MAPAADQPPHAEKIEDPDPKPVPHSVVRLTGMARPVDHIHIADLVAFSPHQRRQKPVQPVEIRQAQKDIAAECFEAAARITGAVAQNGIAYCIGDARLKPLERACPPADALAGDKTDAGRACRTAP